MTRQVERRTSAERAAYMRAYWKRRRQGLPPLPPPVPVQQPEKINHWKLGLLLTHEENSVTAQDRRAKSYLGRRHNIKNYGGLNRHLLENPEQPHAECFGDIHRASLKVGAQPFESDADANARMAAHVAAADRFKTEVAKVIPKLPDVTKIADVISALPPDALNLVGANRYGVLVAQALVAAGAKHVRKSKASHGAVMWALRGEFPTAGAVALAYQTKTRTRSAGPPVVPPPPIKYRGRTVAFPAGDTEVQDAAGNEC